MQFVGMDLFLFFWRKKEKKVACIKVKMAEWCLVHFLARPSPPSSMGSWPQTSALMPGDFYLFFAVQKGDHRSEGIKKRSFHCAPCQNCCLMDWSLQCAISPHVGRLRYRHIIKWVIPHPVDSLVVFLEHQFYDTRLGLVIQTCEDCEWSGYSELLLLLLNNPPTFWMFFLFSFYDSLRDSRHFTQDIRLSYVSFKERLLWNVLCFPFTCVKLCLKMSVAKDCIRPQISLAQYFKDVLRPEGAGAFQMAAYKSLKGHPFPIPPFPYQILKNNLLSKGRGRQMSEGGLHLLWVGFLHFFRGCWDLPWTISRKKDS